MILQELEDPEIRLVGQKSWNRRFPFKEEDVVKFLKVPKLDAALSQVTKRSDLSFKDTGIIKGVMDHSPCQVRHGVLKLPLWPQP